MIKFIHTGDLHLGLQFNNVSFHKEKAMDRRRELWVTFQRIVNYSKEREVDFLFIAGDLFEDAYFTLGDIKRVRDILAEAPNVNILISAGNHDNLNTKSLYLRIEWSKNVHIFNSNKLEVKVYKELNTIIYGYSWDRVEFKDNSLFKELPNIDGDMNNILLLHGDVSKNSNYLPINLNELETLNMDYIALGHIHKPSLFTDKIAYCGCPEPLDFGELGERGIIEGTIDNGTTKIEFLPFSMRSFYEVNIVVDENLGYQDIINKITAIVNANSSKNFYRIRLKGYVQQDMDLTNLYKDVENNFYHLELFNETTPDYDLIALEESNKDNIIGQFILTMKDKNLEDEMVRDALYYGLEALLKGRC